MSNASEELFHCIDEVLSRNDDPALGLVLAEAHPADIAEVYELLDDEKRSRLIFAMDPRMTAEVIMLLDEAERGEIVEEMDGQALTQIVAELPPDDAADVLAELPEDKREEILEQVSEAQSEQIGDLLEYEEDTAGGIMTPELVSLPHHATVGEAIEAVRRTTAEDLHYIYALEDGGKLFGIVPLRRLVTNPPHRRLSEICERDPVVARVTDDQEAIVNAFRKYDISAMPVVDEDKRLVGRITHDDIMDAAEEETEEDFFRMAGTDPAEFETTSVVRAARIRFTWLIPAFLIMAVSATVITVFEKHFSRALFAAVFAFVPMIGAMSGNCGVQTSTIIIRGLASGDLAARRVSLALLREGRIALVLAPLCGIFAALMARLGLPLLKSLGHLQGEFSILHVGLAVGFGMGAAILVANALAIALPFFFHRVGVDPAIASGPIVTTCTDVISVSTYLFIALKLVM